MPNYYSDKNDRQLTLGQRKQRLIDLLDNTFVVPGVAWDAQPVRYFKLNEEWCKILAGWLSWMEDVSCWPDAEDELHAGIQGFLNFEVGIEGGILMSPEDFAQALRDGLYQWSNDVAKQIVSGKTFGFSVDEDGNVSNPTDDDGVPDDATEDDPLTPQDEASEARAGAVKGIRLGLDGCLIDLNNWFGTDMTADVSEEIAFTRFQSKYNIDGETQIQDAITQFWEIRTAGVGPTLTLGVGLEEWLYCEGTRDTDIAAYIIENFTQVHQEYLLNLVGGLDVNQILTWYGNGEQIPSTAYVAYGCVPVETEEFDLNMSTANFVSRLTTRAHKHRHRILIEASGKFTDSDNPGEERDWFWYKNLAGATVFEAPSFVNFDLFPGSAFSALKVPYEPSGVYRVTVDLLGVDSSDDGQITIGKDNGGFALPNTTGLLHMKITDLGQYDT